MNTKCGVAPIRWCDMAELQRASGGIPTGPSAQIAAAEWTRVRFAQFGVPFPAGNRLQRAKALLEEVNARGFVLTPEDDGLLDRVTEAQWTIIEQYIVARSLGRPGRALSPLMRCKLEEMLSGADAPEADRNPLARNTQFELYVGASFTMGGIPVSLGDPDLVFDYLGTPCGLAAKRVRSFRQAPRRADEAADQLGAAGLRGVVAVNVDVLLKITQGLPGPEATLAERLQVVEQLESQMAERAEVVGTMTFGRDCMWDFGGERPSAAISHSLRFTVHPRTQADETTGREFFDRLMARIDARMQTL